LTTVNRQFRDEDDGSDGIGSVVWAAIISTDKVRVDLNLLLVMIPMS
jgi:hypothetical protein